MALQLSGAHIPAKVLTLDQKAMGVCPLIVSVVFRGQQRSLARSVFTAVLARVGNGAIAVPVGVDFTCVCCKRCDEVYICFQPARPSFFLSSAPREGHLLHPVQGTAAASCSCA